MNTERIDRITNDQTSTQNSAGGKSTVIPRDIRDIDSVPFDNLSHQSKVLWAKLSDSPGDISWLPLVIHMSDSCGIS
jgi:hypothetical protein